jgi:adenylate cyclase
MKRGAKAVKKHFAGLIITLAVFLIVAGAYLAGLFDYLEHKTYDFRVLVLAESSRPSDDIVLVLLDQRSIDWANQERGWGWPWPRKAYAEFIEYMDLGGANSVAFDVIFSEPSIYRNARQDVIIDSAVRNLEQARALAAERQAMNTIAPLFREVAGALQELSGYEDDASFIRAEREFGRVVQTVFFSSQTGSVFSWPEDADTPLFAAENFGDFLSKFDLAREEGQVGAQFPIPGLRDAAGAIGNVTGIPDSDGIFRRNRLFTLFDGRAVPGLSAASLLASGRDERIRYNQKKQAIEWGEYTIPVDRDGRSLLRFRGSLNRYIPYSMGDILQSAETYARGEEPLLYPEDFKDKYVFFGYYAPGLYDICSTPIESVYPGVGMHITMLDNILQQDFIRESPPWLGLLISLAAVILMSLLVFYSGRIPLAVGGGLAILAAISAGAFGAYAAGYWLPMVAPIAGVLLVFLAGTLYNYATEGSQKRFIKSAFSQYLSPIYIEQLIANPEQLSLGGARREISIFFSDVQGFTSISEKLDPDQLKELLNDYLSLLTDIIQASGGTIDKYEGDAIIAFWNAPLNLPDHAARALGASLECQQALAERGDFFEEKFRQWNIDTRGINTRLLTRMGLNTGYAVVGNFGSAKHFNYTMLGDAVNLAARLEGLNKQFGTFLMCTENTLTRANEAGAFFGRKLAQVAVVGKKEPVTVFEPLTEAVFRGREEVIRNFDAARDLFYAGKFAEALPLFEALKDQDQPPSFYLGPCRYYMENPAEWKGFWQATSK